MRLVGALLLAALLGACGDLPPIDFIADGARVTLPAERNVPQETAVKPGVEVIVYDKTTWADIRALNCGQPPGHHWVGCTHLITPEMCVVWLVDPALVPAEVGARVRRHEVFGHCNGHDHKLYQTPQGWVLEWHL